MCSDFSSIHVGGGYGSEMEAGSGGNGLGSVQKSLPARSIPGHLYAPPGGRRDFGSSMSTALRTSHRVHEDAYTRHRSFMANYVHYNGSQRMKQCMDQMQEASKTDLDVLEENHQFIRDEEADRKENSWGKRLAVKYYQRLFREYGVADLSRFKEGKIGLRWRTEQEVIAGTGQFTCGTKHCETRQKLHSYELNFAYKEGPQRELKRALVKVRVCPQCAVKLFYKKIKQAKQQQRLAHKAEKKRLKKERKKEHKSKHKRKRNYHSSDEDSAERGREAAVNYDSLVKVADGEGVGGGADIHNVIETLRGKKEEGQDDASASASASGQTEPDAKRPRDVDGPEEDAKKVPSNVWAGPVQAERTDEDDYDDYFEGLFM